MKNEDEKGNLESLISRIFELRFFMDVTLLGVFMSFIQDVKNGSVFV